MRRRMESFVKPMQVDRLCDDGDRGKLSNFARWRTAGNEDDASGRIFGQNVTARGDTVELGHSVIHQDDIRPMTFVGLDGFQTGANDFDDLMSTLGNELSE